MPELEPAVEVEETTEAAVAVEDAPPAQGEEVENEEVEATTTSEDEQEDERQKMGGVQKRFKELTRKNYEAQQQNQALQEQLAAIQQQQQKAQIDQSLNAPMPTLADYGYDEAAYSQAIQQWNAQQIQAFQEGQEKATQAQQAQQQQVKEAQAIQAKMTAAVEKYPDFYAVITNPELPSLQDINPAAYQAIVDSDQFADVAVHVAKNPELIYGFGSMSPVQAIKEVARLEMKLSAPPKVPTKQAPPPPTELEGNAAAYKNMSDLSTEEWMAARNKQILSQRE